METIEKDRASDEKDKAPKAQEVTYTAGPGDPLSVDWNGQRFVSGVPRHIEDDVLLGLVDSNPHFSFKGQDKAADAVKKNEAEAAQREKERVGRLDQEAKLLEVRHKHEVEQMEKRHARENDAMQAKKAADDPKAKPQTAGPQTTPKVRPDPAWANPDPNSDQLRKEPEVIGAVGQPQNMDKAQSLEHGQSASTL